MAAALASAAAGAGAPVVSGAARGIDAAAHRGALAAGGPTVAVLGCGIDEAYPRQNAGLLARIAEVGTIVTEYPPGTRAEPFRFPARNRLIAALSVAVVVVEGAAESGSMITADHALEIGREVMAVPGAVASELARAPLALIREGATMIRGPDDLMDELGLRRRAEPNDAPSTGTVLRADKRDGWSEGECAVWDALLAVEAPDRLVALTRLPLQGVLSALMALELRGVVRRVGGRYERTLKGARC